MSTQTVPTAPSPAGLADPARERAHRLAVWSLVMLAFLIPAAIVSGLVSFVILGSAGLEGSEPMSEQGATGWAALVVGWLILMAPMVVGFVLGARARARGERLGIVGMVVDGVIFAGVTLLMFGNALTG